MDNIRDEIQFIQERNNILLTLEQLATKEGYIKVESDYFEDYLTYISQNERQDQRRLVKIQDLRGNLFVLRPDTTSNIIKQVIPRMDQDLAVQFYYMEKVFSYNENGDIEQTRQFGVELIGNNGSTDNALLELINRVFSTFGLQVTLELGNQQWLEQLLSKITTNKALRSTIKQAIIAKNIDQIKRLLGEEDTPYKTLLLNVLSTESSLEDYMLFIQENKLDNALLDGLNVLQALQTSFPSMTILFDLSLINPFDYYNGPIFKGYMEGYPSDIVRGGRYDYLTSEYGNRTQALGFSLDLDTFIEEVVRRG